MNYPNLLCRIFALCVCVFGLSFTSVMTWASEPELLKLADSIFKSDAQLNREREQLFQLAYDEQQAFLKTSEQRLTVAELEQTRLKHVFDTNEDKLAELETLLNQRSGALGEVFGVAKESALELEPMLQDSMTSADNPGRAEALGFAQSKRVPTAKDFEVLLNELLNEMEASGEVTSFKTQIIDAKGQRVEQEVIRFGVFSSATRNGDYLAWDIAQQSLKTLAAQPSRKLEYASLVDGNAAPVVLDPSRGELFALLDRMPSLKERVEQGGIVGYLIIFLGLVSVLMALYQVVRLLRTELGVRKQLADLSLISDHNPLGRVLKAAGVSSGTDSESTVEMRVDEAILKELSHIEQGQSFLKLMAAVAPLLGLLGTVVGMIATFQSITLFGTSDPKLMANGISQALMTTVLGLVVAVPVLFFHSLLVSRGRRMIQVLQAKSLAAIASGNQQSALPARGESEGPESELHVA